ncbi:NEW3 domain-containing protein [Vogesella facilis]|uniref:NEW3 domain-containing protein n=1 Tax=Vogesella facilis TaxID=1655232 RepID=A0ABV7RC86_9NEIS
MARWAALLAGLLLAGQAASLQAAVPAAQASAQAQVGSAAAVDLEGELQVLHEDDLKNRKSRTRHFLKTDAGERLELHFKGAAARYATGSRVRVRGQQSGSQLALDSSSGSVQVLAQAAGSNPLGVQNTAVLLVNFQDNPGDQRWTQEQWRTLVFGQVSDFVRENSFQQTSLTGQVYGWYTLPISSTSTCDTDAIATAANQAAAAAGVNLAAYTRLVYVFPPVASCAFSGASTIGGVPSKSFINGDNSFRVVTHELGHGLGLDHTHANDCDTSPTGATCTYYEYGDRADVMGSGQGHINAAQKERLGWLNNGVAPAVTTVQQSGTYVIEPYESSGSSAKALKILKGVNPTTGQRSWYYLEYRQPLGADSYLATDPYLKTANVFNGVTVHLDTEGSVYDNYLLDMTPGSLSWYSRADLDDPALVVGQSYTDSAAGVTITPTWANSSGIGVQVSFSAGSCTRGQPSVLLSPLQSTSVSAGAAVGYSVVVSNHDSSGCAATTFNLASVLPSGWSGTLAASSLSIAAGGSGSTTLTVTSSGTAIAGSYGVTASASNVAASQYSASGTASYSVQAQVGTLAVKVATDKASYSLGATVTSTATLSNASGAVANTPVTLLFTKPNGSTVSQTVTSDSKGVASYKLRLGKQKDALGSYQVRASASSGGQSASATTTFAVQ